MKNIKPLVFSTASYRHIAGQIAKAGKFPCGLIEEQTFPDGEYYHRIINQVRDRHVIFVGGLINDRDTLQMYDLSCAMVKYGAISLQIVIPYYGYGTMERSVKPGEVVKAKTRARLLSSIPKAFLGNQILLLDLHSEGIPYYFEGDITTIHLYAEEIIIKAIKDLGYRNYILGSTDAGRAKWVQSYANRLGVTPAFIFKKRISGTKTKVEACSAEIDGTDVIIYDDMIRTGGSLMAAAEAYKKAGAKRISAVTTHGIFPGDSLNRIEDSGLFETIHTTDSHPNAMALAGRFLKVYPVGKVFLKHIRTFI